MDINEDITKEKAMSGKLQMTDKIEDGSETESESTENSKSKNICESSMGKVNPKNVKIIVPSLARDDRSMSSLSKHSHDTYSVPRKKNQKQYLNLYSKVTK